jgi:hypothetical protein
VSSAASCKGRAAPTMTAMAIAETANVRESVRESSWPRVTVGLMGVGLAILVLVAALGLPASDLTVWAEAALTAVSAVALAALVWWLTRRGGVLDRRLVLDRGLGSGLVLGGLWMAEIGFNNLAPPEVSTASSRGVVDNVTWAIVGVVTVAVVVLVTARTRRWRSGLRAGVWSGVGSGLGAGLGGALLLAFLRDFVVRDPLMQAEHIERAPGVEVATYVTRETMAGIFGHLWVLGIVQGALLAVVAATVTAAIIGLGRRRGMAGHDVG